MCSRVCVCVIWVYVNARKRERERERESERGFKSVIVIKCPQLTWFTADLRLPLIFWGTLLIIRVLNNIIALWPWLTFIICSKTICLKIKKVLCSVYLILHYKKSTVWDDSFHSLFFSSIFVVNSLYISCSLKVLSCLTCPLKVLSCLT